jgi:hypothetical protein
MNRYDLSFSSDRISDEYRICKLPILIEEDGVPGPGISIATSAWRMPVVSPPCTTNSINLVSLVKPSSKCNGL